MPFGFASYYGLTSATALATGMVTPLAASGGQASSTIYTATGAFYGDVWLTLPSATGLWGVGTAVELHMRVSLDGGTTFADFGPNTLVGSVGLATTGGTQQYVVRQIVMPPLGTSYVWGIQNGASVALSTSTNNNFRFNTYTEATQ